MKKIRINELARECEQPNSVIIAILPEFGVTEKKTHSSSIDEDVADAIRRHYGVFVEPRAPEIAAEAREPAPAAAAEPGVAEAESAAKPAPAPAEPSAAGVDQAPEMAPIGPAFPPGLTTEEMMIARPAAHPLRPPLATRRGLQPEPAAVAPPPAGVTLAPAPTARAALPVAARPLPTPRPGQIISGPRQPYPAAPAEAPPRTARPSQASRPAASAAPPPAAPQPTPPAAVVTSRPNLAGQPAARPVVPPRPDLVARLAQTKAVPGQPQPRPGAPLRPATAPVPGQPIYKGPIRPGPAFVRTRPGAPGALVPRTRGLHPTSPLRPEPGVVPLLDQQRRAQKDRARPVIDREAEREGKLLHVPISRREEFAKLAEGKQITIAEGITVKELSEKLGIKANLVIKKLVDRKIFATINQTLDVKLAEELAQEFGAISSRVSYEEEATQAEVLQADEEGGPVKRAPVVTIMGHVDHGKTSLLDAIRLSNVVDSEAGGITQHIGAYQVDKNGRRISFIDTPGHEAFTRMRARGAKVTDVVVLVVAADDGVMPQTIEAIDHARAAQVPIIVAINKIDKADAQPERVKQQLSDRGLVPEEWGGDTVMVPVSARTKQHLDLLLEMILLVSDLQDLKANPSRPALATVLEAELDRGRGPVATVLVRNGTLHVGDYFICGSVFGKVRALYDDRSLPIKEAEPSQPAEVLGLESLPEVGDTLQVVTDTAKAKQIVIYRESRAREQAMARSSRITLDQLHQQIKEGEVKELRIILKTDVGGSAEVLSDTLQKLSNDKVKIRVISSGVGAITETDVLLASASNAIVIGFSVRPDRNASAVAEQEKVDIRLHTIIYDLTDEIKRAMTGMLEPVFKEVYRGRAEVRDTFRISKVGTIAGCLVIDGSVTRDSEIRVLRDNVVIYTGKIGSLKRFKDDASEVRSGVECGIAIENFNDVKLGDVLEAFVTERVAPEVLV
ncbi:MAG: translation initiation factor IF-2 [Bryobacteraceae bacterium]|jgi:translation initiation factor IF-2